MKKKSLFRRIVTIFLDLIVLLAVFVITLLYIVPAFETVNKEKQEASTNWMSKLSDDTYLSEVILPGTHDSASKNVKLAYFSKCQALTIKEQLEAGYRYLDIRVALDGDNLKLVHGFVNCTKSGFPFASTLYLDEVLEQCYSFLDENPSESIMFVVKKENKKDSSTNLQKSLHSLIDQKESYWLLKDTIPTVGESRGKLILARRYDDANNLKSIGGIDIDWVDQGKNFGEGKDIELNTKEKLNVWVQDRYKYDTEDKWAAFIDGLGKNKISDDTVSINFLSTNGTPKFGHPYKYAKKLNKMFLEEDTTLNGWIIVDFASSTIAKKIYDCNFS